MSVLFLSSDLVFSSRLAGVGERLGVEVSAASSIEAAVARVSSHSVRLVILDLSATKTEPASAVSQLRAADASLAIVAYAPHVHEEKLQAASDAGCTEVLTRGQFDGQMEALLNRYAKSE